jgi:hypothetical protein
MSGYRHRLLLVFSVCLFSLVGCGGSSQSDDTAARLAPGAHPSKLAVGSKLRDCDVTFDGPGPADWRKHSLWIGPFGLAGPGPGPDFDEGALRAGLLKVKTPTMVAGHRPVTISVPAAQRYRVGILGVHPRPAYASVTYVPCDDKPRTVFAAGFLLRDRRPVTLLVQVGKGPVRGLHLSG